MWVVGVGVVAGYCIVRWTSKGWYVCSLARYGELKYGLSMNVIHLPENHPARLAAVGRFEALKVRQLWVSHTHIPHTPAHAGP